MRRRTRLVVRDRGGKGGKTKPDFAMNIYQGEDGVVGKERSGGKEQSNHFHNPVKPEPTKKPISLEEKKNIKIYTYIYK